MPTTNKLTDAKCRGLKPGDKAIKEFDNVHTAICIKYLKVSKLPLCLLINFGKSRIDVKRIAL